MTNGPIDFGVGAVHEVPATEFGGADGLIQPESDVVLKGDPEASGGHTLESDKRQALYENAAILTRRAMVALPADVAGTGVETRWRDDEVVDPVTGRTADVGRNVAGGAGKGELSDLKP